MTTADARHALIKRLPKAELHIHIEGSFEPELMFDIAQRNKIALPYASVEALKEAYAFNNLQEFLDLYYLGMGALREELDFYQLTTAYLERAAADNVKHVEMFFDPQGHTHRGVPFDVAIGGILAAIDAAEERLGVTATLIMSFLRHLDEEDGFKTLDQSEKWRDRLPAVGLDSSEVGHPPEKFARLFQRCREMGFKLCCHAGEEGPPDYVRQALFEIGVDRIDHGNRAMEDPELARAIAERGVPLTVCPLSNTALKVIARQEDSPVAAMLAAGIVVTVNSDDPAYFGGYMNANLHAVADALDLDEAALVALAENSFAASFLSDDAKAAHIAAVRAATA